MTTLLLEPVYIHTNRDHAGSLALLAAAAKLLYVPVYWIQNAYTVKQDLPKLLEQGEVAYYGKSDVWPSWFAKECNLSMTRVPPQWLCSLPQEYTGRAIRLTCVKDAWPETEEAWFEEGKIPLYIQLVEDTSGIEDGIYTRECIFSQFEYNQDAEVYTSDPIEVERVSTVLTNGRDITSFPSNDDALLDFTRSFLNDDRISIPCPMALKMAWLCNRKQWIVLKAYAAWQTDITHHLPMLALKSILGCTLQDK